MSRILPVLFTALLLAACAGRTPPERRHESARAPLLLTVEEVQFENRSAEPRDGTFIDRRRSRELAERARSFLQERLQAAGGPGVARVVVERAELVERKSEKTGGVLGVFVREPDRILDGTLAVRVSVEDWGGVERAFARAEVARRRPVLEYTDVASVDAEAERLIEDLLAQLDEALQKSVEENLAAFLAF